jgi:hypothetical protein
MATALMTTGDTASASITWSTTGGRLSHTVTVGGRHMVTYFLSPNAPIGDYLVIARSVDGLADTVRVHNVYP